MVEAATHDEWGWIRRQAAFALAELKDASATAALQERYDARPAEDDTNIRVAQWTALRQMGVVPKRKPWEPGVPMGPAGRT